MNINVTDKWGGFMGENIHAVTKYYQKEQTLKLMTEKALNRDISVFSAKLMHGGFSNAVYLIHADHEKLVLKLAPHKDVVLMRHEYGSIFTEVDVLKKLNGHVTIEIPKLIYFDDSHELTDSEYFFMSFIEGEPLMQLKDRPTDLEVDKMKYEIGVFTKELLSFESEHFCVPALKETFSKTNSEFVYKLFEMLYDDASDKSIYIPGINKENMLMLINNHRHILNEASKPYLCHTDTWDGNLMVKDNKLVGLIDFQTMLYADPLMNHDFHDFAQTPNKSFLDGYQKHVFNKHEQIRLCFYEMWQRLGMTVEVGYREYEDQGMYDWAKLEYVKSLNKLLELTKEEL